MSDRQVAARRGWSNKGNNKNGKSDFPARAGCVWNEREDNDLLEAHRAGNSTSKLAKKHFRTVTAIEQRLERLIADSLTNEGEAMEDKYYSLLRPFDPKTAKAGDVLCSIRGNLEREFVAGPDHCGLVCVAIEGNYNLVWPSDLRLAPLCWVEGRPVYKGDRLSLKKCDGTIIGTIVADGTAKNSSQQECIVSGFNTPHDEMWWPLHCLTWAPPKVKREGWVNIYPRPLEELIAPVSHAHASKDAADAVAAPGRIACIRVEWEEPA